MSLLSVPLLEQELRNSCVAASARMVLACSGEHQSEPELRTLMRYDDGFRMAYIKLRPAEAHP